jgi:hypothetical protein
VKPLPSVVAEYAPRLHRLAGAGHHVASPLGAWVLLGLIAPLAHGDERDGLERVLGAPIDHAHELALQLMADPHPAVPLAAAAWGIDSALAQRAFGPDVEVGPVPDQAGADKWTREHTLDLIDAFPLPVANAVAVLATAIATKISWERAFQVVPADQAALARTPGFASVARLLLDPGDGPSQQLITDSDAGLLAVHAAASTDDDLLVVSVSADPAVPHDEVLAAAHPVATALARHDPLPDRRSLFDLPLGAGHSWSLTESIDRGPEPEQFRSLLPAWSSATRLDLMASADVGFLAAAGTFRRLIGGAKKVDAAQAAIARYTRTGFEAAAVTGVMARAAMVVHAERRRRIATLEFTHPFAVVAAACDRAGGPWAGLPVFSAWVTEADEPDQG